MKRIVIVALVALAGFQFYQNGFSWFAPNGAFDKQGKPRVVLFVGPGCGAPCEDMRSALAGRRITYEELSIAGPDGAPVSNPYGINQYPVTLVGKYRVLGNDTMQLVSALGEAYGADALSRSEQRAMNNHFDAQGRPRVVMYGTSWCGYCRKQREFFAARGIAFENIDVEASESAHLAYQALQGAGYPLTYVGYRRFTGYQEGAIASAVDELL